ncbi:Protein of unknown function (DUF707, partial [Striga hermonthica]
IVAAGVDPKQQTFLFCSKATRRKMKSLMQSSRHVHLLVINSVMPGSINGQRLMEERIEISQPGLDHGNSKVHHHITVRHHRSTVHMSAEMKRTYYRFKGGGPGTCDDNSTTPLCR